MSFRRFVSFAILLAVINAFAALPAATAQELPDPLPDPDGKPADMSQPVQVYILLGQSNMLGFGKIGAADKPGSLTHAVQEKGLYPYLVDDAGNWTTRNDVRNVRVMGSGTGGMRRFNNEWMTITKSNIGPEIGIGHYVGHATDAPVMVLKSCIGNRSLSWDLLPPGSESWEFEDGDKVWHYAGYKESPLRWEKGTEPEPINWYAGMQYDGDIARAKKVLDELETYYPGAKGYEIAGFFFWQGDKDRYNAGHASRYEVNLVQLIKQLRKDFDAPDAKFVCATLGQTEKGADGNEGLILEAQLAVDGETLCEGPLVLGAAAPDSAAVQAAVRRAVHRFLCRTPRSRRPSPRSRRDDRQQPDLRRLAPGSGSELPSPRPRPRHRRGIPSY